MGRNLMIWPTIVHHLTMMHPQITMKMTVKHLMMAWVILMLMELQHSQCHSYRECHSCRVQQKVAKASNSWWIFCNFFARLLQVIDVKQWWQVFSCSWLMSWKVLHYLIWTKLQDGTLWLLNFWKLSTPSKVPLYHRTPAHQIIQHQVLHFPDWEGPLYQDWNPTMNKQTQC